MNTNEYLYGDEVPLDVPTVVIESRLSILRKRLNEELEKEASEWDMVYTEDLIDAIEFWSTINDRGE